MAKISKEEKLSKINEQIENEQQQILKSKKKIQSLKAQKKKLESEIQNKKYSELKDVLQDYGIKSADDFQNFLNNCTNPQNGKQAENSNDNDEL